LARSFEFLLKGVKSRAIKILCFLISYRKHSKMPRPVLCYSMQRIG
uniref:IS4 family transposase n=1 Tax=Rodentolepis nana TaxID=102285 RepID=A0A0R3TY22_RODNA